MKTNSILVNNIPVKSVFFTAYLLCITQVLIVYHQIFSINKHVVFIF